MGKSKSARQKTQVYEPPKSRAGAPHDWAKSDDELDLEERLFGTSGTGRKRQRESNGRSVHLKEVQGEDDSIADLSDSELFTIDVGGSVLPRQGAAEDESDTEHDDLTGGGDNRTGEESLSVDEDGASSSSSSQEDRSGRKKGRTDHTISLPDDLVDMRVRSPSRKGKERAAVWQDPADETIVVDLNGEKRTKKLARGQKGESTVSGKEYEKRLREQFERLHPRPAWASGRAVNGTPSLTSLLASTKSFIDAPHGHLKKLEQGVIDIQRVKDANHDNPTTGKKEASNAGGGVVDFAWHPSKRVGVMAVAGGDRRVRFFNIDGHTNSTLMTIHIPSLPLTKSTFHPSGSSLLLTGIRPYYYTYDLPSQRCLRSPNNLFGSQASATSPNSLTRHAFSPDGSLLAVAGKRGAVSVMEWNSVGVGAVVAELKSGRGGAVEDMIWTRDGELSVLGGRDGAELEVWDIGSRRIVRKWSDDRAFGGRIMRSSPDGSYRAIGSSTGIVNLYSESSLLAERSTNPEVLPTLRPEPMKSLEHLTTPISSLAFHPSSELLATASTAKRNAFKLYHLPSATAFSNWPTQQTPIGRATCVGFSSGGEYVAVGNNRGSVLLWSLKHYALS